MKRTILSLLAIVMTAAFSLPCSAQDRLFKNMSDLKGCTSIYVGKAVLKLAGSSSSFIGNLDNVNLKKLYDKINSIEVVACDDDEYAAAINKKISELVAGISDLNLLTEVNENDGDGSSNVTIYTRQKPGSDIINTLLIVVMGDDDPTLVAFHGDFTMDDILAALQHADNNVLGN